MPGIELAGVWVLVHPATQIGDSRFEGGVHGFWEWPIREVKWRFRFLAAPQLRFF